MDILTIAARLANQSKLLDLYCYLRQSLTGHHLAILLYHRVAPRSGHWSSYSSIIPSDFERQLAYLASNFHVIPLLELAHIIQNDLTFPKKAAVITFDDGYKDNYLFAYPLLKKYGLPATIFLTSGYIGRDQLFWWDKVNYLIEHTSMKTLDLPDLGIFSLSSTLQRRKVFTHIRDKLKTMPEAEKQKMIGYLASETKIEVPPGIAANLILSWEEVREMAGQWIEFGSHGVTHAILTNLQEEEAEIEMVVSKKEIEERLQKPVLSFSYPNGGFRSEMGGVLKKSGYKCAVIVRGKIAKKKDDPYELPRISGFGDFNKFKLNISGFYPDFFL